MRTIIVLLLIGCSVPNGGYDAGFLDAMPDGSDARVDPITCTAHEECRSLVCSSAGTCAQEADIAYVEAKGSGSACTRAEPCNTLGPAMGLGRKIKIVGAVLDNVRVPAGSFEIVGGATSALAAVDAGAVIEIRQESTVIVRNLAIGSTGAQSVTGVTVSNRAAKVYLEEVVISGVRFDGIYADSGELHVARSSLRDNGLCGVFARFGVKLDVQRSVIAGNAQCGITLDPTVNFTIVNNMIVGNGLPDQGAGGVVMNVNDTFTTTRVFSHNTIAQNHAALQSLKAGGVHCLSTRPVTLGAGNVIAFNTVHNGAMEPTSNVEPTSSCTFSSSVIATPAAQLGFVAANTSNWNYHLLPGSSLVDAGPPSGIAVDFDGNARDATPDIGADEVTP